MRPMCNCDYGTIDQARVEAVKEHLRPEQDLGRALKPFEKEYDTRSRHASGCPVDVLKYDPGEFYCNTTLSWANSSLVSNSQGMLETGPLNEDDPDFERIRGQAGFTGVYRTKEQDS